MTCDAAKNEIILFLYGELDFNQEELLDQHLDECSSCRALLESEKRLHSLFDLTDSPVTAGELARNRRDLHFRLAAEARPKPSTHSLLEAIRRFLDFRITALDHAWKYAAAAGALAVVFAAGRWSGGGPLPLWDLAAAPQSPAIARVRFLDQPDESGRVRLVVDETRQRIVTGTLQDDTVRGLLMSAMRDPQDPGLRAESVALLNSRGSDSAVRRALLQALREDPNPDVRLKALTGLKDYAAEPETRETLAEALLKDENPGVRVQAIDLLVQHKEKEIVGVLQECLRKEENPYVRMRSQRVLREMNASEGTY